MAKAAGYKEYFLCFIVFLAAFIVLSAGLRSISYSNPDEKRYKESAEEMLESGDWVTPHYHGRPRFQKPILFYWFTAASMSIFGKGWFGARFFSSVCGAMTVLLSYLIAKFFYGRRAGMFSASLLTISALFFLYSRLSTPDMMTLAFITLSIYIFIKLCTQANARFLSPLFFGAVALATLTKGFVGFLIPVIITAIFTYKFKKPNLLRKADFPLGVIIFLAITLPWFLKMYSVHGAVYLRHIWQVETLGRANNICASAGCPLIKVFVYFFRYLVMACAVFLPATIFLPASIAEGIRHKDKEKDALLIIWMFTVLIFFTIIGTKKIHYLLLMAPPLSIFIGKPLARAVDSGKFNLEFFVPLVLAAAFYATGMSMLFIVVELLGVGISSFWIAAMAGATVALVLRLIKKDFLGSMSFFIVATVLIMVFTFGHLLPALSRDNGLLVLSEEILSEIEDGEVVGVGSHHISHNRLDSYLGVNVKKVNVDLRDQKEQSAKSARLLTEFLTKKERVFCVITKQEYAEYLPEELKGSVYILGKEWYWKKPNQFEFNSDLLMAILRRDRALFKDLTKNEIYLISNKP